MFDKEAEPTIKLLKRVTKLKKEDQLVVMEELFNFWVRVERRLGRLPKHGDVVKVSE